jgi:hypothetical protein
MILPVVDSKYHFLLATSFANYFTSGNAAKAGS